MTGLEEKFAYQNESLANMDDLDLDKALVKLRAAETRMSVGKQRRTAPFKAALAATTADAPKAWKPRKPIDDKRVERRKGFLCHEVGHLRADCPGNARKPLAHGGVAMFAAAGCALHGMRGPPGPEMGAGNGLPEGWIVDSGASHHMTGDDQTLTQLGPCEPVIIKMANGEVHTATKAGTAEFDALVRGDKMRVTLEDVLVVPRLTVALLSVPTAVNRGFAVTFDALGVSIRKGGNVVMEGIHLGDVWVVARPYDEANYVGGGHAAVAARVWHRRFAHAGPDTLARVPQAVTGMQVTPAQLRRQGGVGCDPCMRGKMTRLPFPTSTTRSSRPLELIHTDVCGPMDVKTPGKDRFQVVVIDDFSRYRAVVPVASKGLAKNVLMVTLNL